jgi:ribulose-bisphosphate carboxylase large chain
LERAREIAFEQTVELPRGAIPRVLEERVVGRVEAVRALDAEGRWEAVISYDPAVVGDDLPQLLNLLYGNVSLQGGARLVDVELAAEVLGRLPGPRFGIAGLRALAGCETGRALLCVALKPLGLTPLELADLALRFALAGVDIVKDDHGLANQASAPFGERVRCCQDAVARANARTGGSTLYVPNLTGPVETLNQRAELLRKVGCRAALVSPFLLGLDTVRWLAVQGEFALLAHPALAGAWSGRYHGIAPDVLFGLLFRVIGGDGVIYPNVGGRFPFTLAICETINRRLRSPLGALRPAFPVPGGGVDAARIPEWIERYGPDTIFLVGTTLYGRPDLERATRALVEEVRRCGEA